MTTVNFWQKMSEIMSELSPNAQRYFLLIQSTGGNSFVEEKAKEDRILLFAAILGFPLQTDEEERLTREYLEVLRLEIVKKIGQWNEAAKASRIVFDSEGPSRFIFDGDPNDGRW